MGASVLDYTIEGDDFQHMRVALAPGEALRAEPGSFPAPGKLLCVDLARGPVIFQRDAYLCSTPDAEVTLAFTRRFGAGLLGGDWGSGSSG